MIDIAENTTQSLRSDLHHDYYNALEQDLIKISRYIEFHETNLKTYSIELAHLLFAAASEVDVIFRKLHEHKQPKARKGNKDPRYIISDYKKLTKTHFRAIPKYTCSIGRYKLYISPFKAWKNEDGNPEWWESYNKVKHNRSNEFQRANLQNALTAMCALAIMNRTLKEVDPNHCAYFAQLEKDAFIRIGLAPLYESAEVNA